MVSTAEITQLLKNWGDGDEVALEILTPLLYKELHRMARRHMRGERPDHTLQPTALIHEAFLRLTDWESVQWQNRAHFFGLAAQMMRRILVDFARTRKSHKHGGGMQVVPLDEALVVSQNRSRELLALDMALKGLSDMDPRKSQVVELRFFGGL